MLNQILFLFPKQPFNWHPCLQIVSQWARQRMRMHYFVVKTPKKGRAAQKVTRILISPTFFFSFFLFFFVQDSKKKDIVAPTNGKSEDEGS